MTLIITELSQYGIVMVADSAVTFHTEIEGRGVQYVLNGAKKLQAIPYLEAGIAMWGLGSVPVSNHHVSTDVWIDDFVQRHSAVSSLDEFALALTDELQTRLRGVNQALGFHLAGYVDVGGSMLPTFYHIRNVDGDFSHYQLHDFIPGHDFPPTELGIGSEPYLTRNGDYGPYAIMAAAVNGFLPAVKQLADLEIPYPSLFGRIAYHCAWVRFVSDLYASSYRPRTIGGTVTALGIDPHGKRHLHQVDV